MHADHILTVIAAAGLCACLATPTALADTSAEPAEDIDAQTIDSAASVRAAVSEMLAEGSTPYDWSSSHFLASLDLDAQPETTDDSGAADDAATSGKSIPLDKAPYGHPPHGNLAEQATNPVAPVVQLQIQNNFVLDSTDSSGYANQFIIQPVIPMDPIAEGLPRMIWRPTIPIVTTPDIDDGPNQTSGVGDIVLLGGPVFNFKGGMLVVGPAITFPTATNELLGLRKWQMGPVIGPIFTFIPRTQLGILAYNQWGFGGPGGDSTNILSLQIVGIYHFDEGWYAGWGDQIITYDWINSNWYIPLSVRGGKVFAIGKQHLNVFVEPWVNVGDELTGQGKWGIKLNITFLFPTG